MDPSCRIHDDCTSCLGQSKQECVWIEGEGPWPCRDGLYVDFVEGSQLLSVLSDCKEAVTNSISETSAYVSIGIVFFWVVAVALVLVAIVFLHRRLYGRNKMSFRMRWQANNPEKEFIELVSLA